MARLVANTLAARWSHSVVVNNPGGNAIIGTELVVKDAPDGHTILLALSAFVTGPSLFAQQPEQAVCGFAPVATIATAGLVLVVGPSLQPNNLQKFIPLAKSKPGKLTCASLGAAAKTHLSAALFCGMTGVKMQHIPYKGFSVLVTDL